jgi:hypothetical protein
VDDVQPVGDGVESQNVRVGATDQDRVGEQRPQLTLGGCAEGRWVVGNGVVVENRQRCVEVIETGIHQLERDHRHPQRRSDLRVCTRVGAKTVGS